MRDVRDISRENFDMKAKGRKRERELRIVRSLEFTRSDALISISVSRLENASPLDARLNLSNRSEEERIAERVSYRGARARFAEVHSTYQTRRVVKRKKERLAIPSRSGGFSTNCTRAARARHINSNGKRIKPPHFLARAPLLFSPNVKSFQRNFRTGEKRSAQIYRT